QAPPPAWDLATSRYTPTQKPLGLRYVPYMGLRSAPHPGSRWRFPIPEVAQNQHHRCHPGVCLVSTTPRPPRQRWLLCPHHPTAVPDDESSAALTALVKGAQSCCIFVSIDLAASIPLVKDLPGSQRFRAVAIPLRVTTWPGGATTHQPDRQDHSAHHTNHQQRPKQPHPPPAHHRTITIHHVLSPFCILPPTTAQSHRNPTQRLPLMGLTNRYYGHR